MYVNQFYNFHNNYCHSNSKKYNNNKSLKKKDEKL